MGALGIGVTMTVALATGADPARVKRCMEGRYLNVSILGTTPEGITIEAIACDKGQLSQLAYDIDSSWRRIPGVSRVIVDEKSYRVAEMPGRTNLRALNGCGD